MKTNLVLLLSLIILCAATASATNPVPLINQPLVPTAVAPGGPGFTLTVNGTGFTNRSVIEWNGATRPTTLVSKQQLQAVITAADISAAGTASITVVNPSGVNSNVAFFHVATPISSVTLYTERFPAESLSAGATVSADFNHDGNLDFAFMISDFVSGNSVSIVLGNGDGTFQPATKYSLIGAATGAFAADLNHDGNLDLILATYGVDSEGTVSILLGNGDGNFQPELDFATGGYGGIVGADFNGDGNLDLAVPGNYQSGITMATLLGNGDGTFRPAVSYGKTGAAIAAGDFNRDGKIDLATVDGNANKVSIWIGKGDGSFQSPVTYTANNQPVSLIATDLNGDGNLDILTGNAPDSGGYFVSVLVGNGQGGFGPTVTYPINSYPTAMVTGDFNADGKIDLGVSNGGFGLFLGNGDGTLQPQVVYDQDAFLQGQTSIGDFDQDGRLDVAAPNFFGASIDLLVQAPVLSVNFSSPFVNFPSQNIGTSSTQAAYLMNLGAGDVDISGIGISGPDASSFSFTHNCGSVLPVNSSCQVLVTFTPQTMGPLTATLGATDNAFQSPQTAALSGTGVAPQVALVPSILRFPKQLINTSSQPQSISLTNTGNGTLQMARIRINGDFLQSSTCGPQLAAGQSCLITVTFHPHSVGVLSGSVVIADNAPGSPHRAFLSGIGTSVLLSAAGINFGDQQTGTSSSPVPITMTNEGSVPLNISGITIAGSGAQVFSQTNDCGTSLGAGLTCTINVTFSPKTLGIRNAILEITDDGGASPQKISLSGTGD